LSEDNRGKHAELGSAHSQFSIFSVLFPRSALLLEIQRSRIDAVAHACRPRAVREKMPQMTTAMAAKHFGADHTETPVQAFHDLPFLRFLIEGRPSATTVEFRTGGEQQTATARAGIDPLLKMKVILARERAFGAMLAEHSILLRTEP
jgi:hypothetical protein